MTESFTKTIGDVPVSEWIVGQLIVLDWYDGPTGGLCALLQPRCTVYFEMVAQNWVDGTFRDRLFRLTVTRDDALPRYLKAHGLDVAPSHPSWAPAAEYHNESHRRAVEEAVDAILHGTTPGTVFVRSSDMLTMSELWLGSPSAFRTTE